MKPKLRFTQHTQMIHTENYENRLTFKKLDSCIYYFIFQSWFANNCLAHKLNIPTETVLRLFITNVTTTTITTNTKAIALKR